MRRLISIGMDWLLILLALVLCAMVVLSTFNVVARYVFNDSVLWADEIAVFAMIVVAWLGAIFCAWRGSHISLGIVSDSLPVGGAHYLAVIREFATAAICLFVAFLSFIYVERVYRFGMTSDAARIPVWFVHGALTLSLCFMSVIHFGKAVRVLVKDNPKKEKSLSSGDQA